MGKIRKIQRNLPDIIVEVYWSRDKVLLDLCNDYQAVL